QVLLDPSSNRRQDLAEGEQALVLRLVADLLPLRVVAVLLAPARVAAGRLDVAARMRADPDVGPGRRDRERPDARDRLAVADQLAVGIEVGERPAGPAPSDAGRAVDDVAEAGRLGRRGRIGSDLSGRATEAR